MRLQSRVLITLGIIWGITCIAVYIDSQVTLEHTYSQLEEKIGAKDIHRAQKVIDNSLATLSSFTANNAQWDDMYQFMKDKNKSFIDANFVPTTFITGGINFFMMMDMNHQFFYGKEFNSEDNKFTPVPLELINYLQAHPDLLATTNTETHHQGIIELSTGLVLMSMQPIVTTNGQGPVRGTLINGYYLTKSHIDKLSETLELNLNIIQLPLTKTDIKYLNVYNHLLNGKDHYLEFIDKNLAYGFTLLKDINSQPVALLKIEMPRTFYSEGLMTMYRYIGIVIMLGIFILVTMWYLLKYLVLDRIVTVSKQVIDIYSKGEFQARVKVSGKDEIQDMTSSINSMLELIELTQDQLKYRIAKRTSELEKLSLLNRNLFGEISQQKSIETKLREEEKALTKMAYYDSLTDLPNRGFFSELLLKAITHAKNTRQKVAILFLDADKFKSINDTYGHIFGDKFLKTVATRLRYAVKDTDVAARLAGDEFILFITQCQDRAMMDHEIRSILEGLSKTITIDDISLTIRFSIGVSVYPDDGKTIEELINQADLAMYYAKKHDGNSYYYYKDIESQQTEA